MSNDQFCEYERKPYQILPTCKYCGTRQNIYSGAQVCKARKPITEHERSLEQREKVWWWFSHGAPGITTDGPYVLDKRDVWYMRCVDEQDAGYLLDVDNEFVQVDLCHICLCLAACELLTECSVCFAKVCCDCSCGCEEPADWDLSQAGPFTGKIEIPENKREWVTMENGSRFSVGTATDKPTGRVSECRWFETPMKAEDLNTLREAMADTDTEIEWCSIPRGTDAYEEFAKLIYGGVDLAPGKDMSVVMWDVRCLACKAWHHIPVRKGQQSYRITCECGEVLEFTQYGD